MYFIFVSNDIEAAELFENVLHAVDAKRLLITVASGFDLLQFLGSVKKGESYPDLIVLTPKLLRISGSELLELLKTDDMYRLIPVFMLLPQDSAHQEDACRKMATEFAGQPESEDEWTSAVHKMCEACA